MRERTASRHSKAAVGEPGVLMMRLRPNVPLRDRDKAP